MLKALNKLSDLQREDYVRLFQNILSSETFNKKKIIIKLLDSSLSNYLPHSNVEVLELAQSLMKSVTEVKSYINAIKDDNTSFGCKGSRIAILFPQITGLNYTIKYIFNIFYLLLYILFY